MTKERAAGVIERLAAGECMDEMLTGPAFLEFFRLLGRYSDLEQDYSRAIAARAELFASQVVPIADNPDLDPQRARNAINARQWYASKASPKRWGDRLEVDVSGGLDLRAAMARAATRMQPHDGQELTNADAEPRALPQPPDTASEPEQDEDIDPFS